MRGHNGGDDLRCLGVSCRGVGVDFGGSNWPIIDESWDLYRMPLVGTDARNCVAVGDL